MEERYGGTRSALAATVDSYLRLRLWRIRLGGCAGLGRRVTGVMGPLPPLDGGKGPITPRAEASDGGEGPFTPERTGCVVNLAPVRHVRAIAGLATAAMPAGQWGRGTQSRTAADGSGQCCL